MGEERLEPEGRRESENDSRERPGGARIAGKIAANVLGHDGPGVGSMQAVNRHAGIGVEKNDLAAGAQQQRSGEGAAGARVRQIDLCASDACELRHRAAELVRERADVEAEGEQRTGDEHRDEHERDLDGGEAFEFGVRVESSWGRRS